MLNLNLQIKIKRGKPHSFVNKNRKSSSVTEYKVFPDRGHSLTVDSGWKDVANASLTWLKSKGL